MYARATEDDVLMISNEDRCDIQDAMCDAGQQPEELNVRRYFSLGGEVLPDS